MDRLDAMRLFTRIVERRSFTEAAHDTGVPRSTVTTVIRQLEERLGVRLLQRTTRTVRPTLDGEAYYRRCLAILDDIEDAEGAFKDAEPKGVLRVEVQGTLARHFLMPGLPDFFERYPGIQLSMSERDRWIDPVQEGVDCLLRYGELPDSDLAARRVATLERVTCAAPSYLSRYGTPSSISDLADHRLVGIRLLSTGNLTPVEFQVESELRRIEMPALFSVTGPESYLLGVQLGLGLAQLPRFHVERDLASGALVELLSDTPPPRLPWRFCIRAADSSHLASGCFSTGRRSSLRSESGFQAAMRFDPKNREIWPGIPLPALEQDQRSARPFAEIIHRLR